MPSSALYPLDFHPPQFPWHTQTFSSTNVTFDKFIRVPKKGNYVLEAEGVLKGL